MTPFKQIIKSKGMTLSKLANLLEITRPTLNAYIKQYEAGCLSKPSIQCLFDYIKQSEPFNIETFYTLLPPKKKAQVLGALPQPHTFSPSEIGMIQTIFDQLHEELASGYLDLECYQFINLYLKKYRYQKAFRSLMRGCLVLGGMEVSDSTNFQETLFWAHLVDCFQKFEQESLPVHSELLTAFEDLIKEQQLKKSAKYLELQAEFEQRWDQTLTDLKAEGLIMDELLSLTSTEFFQRMLDVKAG